MMTLIASSMCASSRPNTSQSGCAPEISSAPAPSRSNWNTGTWALTEIAGNELPLSYSMPNPTLAPLSASSTTTKMVAPESLKSGTQTALPCSSLSGAPSTSSTNAISASRCSSRYIIELRPRLLPLGLPSGSWNQSPCSSPSRVRPTASASVPNTSRF